jgi:hypothetical protein
LFLAGLVLGVGAGYAVFEYNGGLLREDGRLALGLMDHFVKTLSVGDQVSLREERHGYSLEVLAAPEAEAPQAGEPKQDAGAAVYEVTKVRRDHVALRSADQEIVIPISKISNISHLKAEPENTPPR